MKGHAHVCSAWCRLTVIIITEGKTGNRERQAEAGGKNNNHSRRFEKRDTEMESKAKLQHVFFHSVEAQRTVMVVVLG